MGASADADASANADAAAAVDPGGVADTRAASVGPPNTRVPWRAAMKAGPLTPAPPGQPGRSGWIVLLAAVLAVAGTARLGWWQLDRARQKTERQEALSRQKALPALTSGQLPLKPAEAAVAEHRAARLVGQWRDAQTVYLDNRSMAGRVGFIVLTPLVLEGGAVVLVQRGLWPRHVTDPTRVDAPAAPLGLRAVHGRIALTPSRMFDLAQVGHLGLTASNSGSAPGRIRQNLDLAAYAAETGLPLLPFVVVQEDQAATSMLRPPVAGSALASGAARAGAPVESATASSSPSPSPSVDPNGAADGLMRQWPEPDFGKQKHYGYAAQWFALSLLVLGLYLWFQVVQPRRIAGAARRATHLSA